MPDHSSVLPRPEYPRPDRQRGFLEGVDWLNLNGPWAFRFDGERRGGEDGWFQAGPTTAGTAWDEQIIVPFCWESLAAWGQGDEAGNEHYYATRVFRDPLAVTRFNYRVAPRYEVGWYRRRVRVPRTGAWTDRRAILTVGAADFFTAGWCNGQPLGRHEGGYTPFEFDLTDALPAPDADGFAEAVIVLRVEDPMDHAEQPVGKQWSWYMTTSGIWQTVFLEPRASTHLRPFRIVPDLIAGAAGFHLPVAGARDGDEVEVEIRPPDAARQAPYRHTLAVVGGVASGSILAHGRVPWDHADPQLYFVRLRLRRGGETLDTVQTYFGLRTVGTHVADADGDGRADPAALTLNGQPVYLRGALHQSFYPDGIYTAGDAETLRQDIGFAKRAGFDFLRIHIKIDDPLLLYYADTMGILLMQDFPNFGEGGDTPLGRRRYEEMMRAAIERDFNHPSVIAWCLFNETWGFGGQVELVKLFGQAPVAENPDQGKQKLANQGSLAWIQSIWELAKELDPTRLVEDMSVVYWEHLDYYAHGDTDINSWHFYINDYDQARAHIEKIVHSTYAGSLFNYAEGYAQKRQPLITSEYGGVGALDGDRDISWSFRFLTNELRRQPKLSAYVFTQLHDVEWEYNGFLNYDRTAKDFGYDPAMVNAGDVLPVDAPPIRRAAPGEAVEVPVATSHYARRVRENVRLQWRLSGTDALGRVHAELARGGHPVAFPARRVASAGVVAFHLPDGETAALPMRCRLDLVAEAGADEIGGGGEALARNYVEFLVAHPAGYPPAREERGDGTLILRAHPADWSDARWDDGRFNPDRGRAGAADRTEGSGRGYLTWRLPLGGVDPASIRRLHLLAEASARRAQANPQTDVHVHPSLLLVELNGVPVFRGLLPDHPHDSRGALSYLRGGMGAYGYPIRATVEGEALRRVFAGAGEDAGHLRVTCVVPEDAPAGGGLVLYGPECGRFPFGLTVVVER